ncbi:hypothetical protein QZM22_30990, partial [Burkholderia oklahomensis]|uniref:hypothetical protein n=1 Tax=Burkholderia oklahomensis TaxID=342113 RepID=UPI002651EE28
IQTSSKFAGISRQYASFLQIQQHRFGISTFLHMHRRIVQGRLFIRMALTKAIEINNGKPLDFVYSGNC